MILNILVCVFLLGMVVLWSTYGFFSSFLNLLVTVAAGLLAFAVWEPAAYWMLGMGWSTSAWGLGLLLPYTVIFIGLRLAILATVRKNLGFHPVMDQVGGGALGLASGVLVSGILVIGAGMMAGDKDLLSVQQFRLNEDGTVAEDKQNGVSLWLPVDRLAGGLFEFLAGGSFAPTGGGFNLASAHPAVAEGAEKYRLSADPMATRTAAPGDGVKMTGVYTMDYSPEAVEALLRRSAAYAVMKKDAVDEVWKGNDQKQVETRLADLVAEANTKGDLEKTLFDGKYLGNTDRKGVRGLLGRSLGEAPESVLRHLWDYAVDQVPGGAASVKGDHAPAPTQKLFTRFKGDDRLVVVDTVWDREKSKAYDEGILRLSPHQIKVVGAGGKQRYQPLAWSTAMLSTPPGFARRELLEIAGGKVGIYGTLAQPGSPDRLAFLFAVPKSVELSAVEIRGIRFPLERGQVKTVSAGSSSSEELAQLVGHLLPPGDPEAKPTNVGAAAQAPEAPVDAKVALGTLEFSNRLPIVMNWVNPEQTAKFEQNKYDVSLISGDFYREIARDMGQSQQKLTKIKVPDGFRSVRLALTLDDCHTLWGSMLDAGDRGAQELAIRTEGRRIAPIGFVLAQGDGCRVQVDANGGHKVTGQALAALRPTVGEKDRLFVYFFLDESESLQGYGLLDGASGKLNDKQQYDLEKPVAMKRIPVAR